jgi:hypothetical protein
LNEAFLGREIHYDNKIGSREERFGELKFMFDFINFHHFGIFGSDDRGINKCRE